MSLPRVLILDDEKHVRESVRCQLDLRGYETAGAATSSEALSILGASPFDLVVCDPRVSGSGGIEFLRKRSSCIRQPAWC